MDINDAQKELIHFKNGVVNLKDGSFRKRVQTDFVTRCLPYDYGVRDEALIGTIMSTLRQDRRIKSPFKKQLYVN